MKKIYIINILKYLIYIVVAIIVFIMAYDYIEKEASKYFKDREKILGSNEGVENYVKPLTMKNFIQNIKDNDSLTSEGLVSTSGEKYIFETYYKMIIVAKNFSGKNTDMVVEVSLIYEDGIAYRAIIKALEPNMNDMQLDSLVDELNDNEEFKYSGKGIILDKNKDYIVIKRNTTY